MPSASSSVTGRERKSTGSSEQYMPPSTHAGQGQKDTGHTGQNILPPASASSSVGFAGAGDMSHPSGQEYRELPVQDVSDGDFSGDDSSVVEEGEVSSDNIDRQDQTEDMTFRETVRSVRSFMGCDHIPVFESDLSEPDKSNNPWKGKNPKKLARISVAMPPDDWPCQKLERLNTTIAEGYPSRAQDSAGLKKDQFVMIPKTHEPVVPDAYY